MFLSILTPVLRVQAQVAGGTLSVTVTDPSGSSVANATVAIKATATGLTRTVTTDEAGLYSAPTFFPRAYDVTATATGFQTVVQTGITISVGAQQTLNIKLLVGQVSQTVEVAAQAPQI